MKALLALLLAASAVCAQEIPIADVVRDTNRLSSPQDKQVCVNAYRALQSHISKINATMVNMEKHPELGYDVQFQHRIAIGVIIVQKTEATLDQIDRMARFNGNGPACIEKSKEGVRLATEIFEANIAYRRY